MSNLLAAIGNTPLVKLNHISKSVHSNIYAKLEYTNPGGSVKDRIAKYMIDKAELEGKLKPGDTIIENSSGNTAMGLAIVSIQKGYKLKIVIRDTTSQEKINMLKVLGVDVIEVDASIPPEEPNSYNNLAKTLADKNPNYFYIDQHNNLDNNEAHYKYLGPEIWEQTQGNVDYLIAGIGTGGSLFGAGKFLKEKNPKLKIIGIDPIGSVFYHYFKTGKLITPSSYKLEGIGDEFLIKTAQLHMLDDCIQVSDEDAINWTRKLASEEGIIAGGSSGANVFGAVQLASQLDKPKNIVTIFCDSGYKYLSTIYNNNWLRKLNYKESFKSYQTK